MHLFCLGYFQLQLSQSSAECPSASFGENLPVLTHLGMEQAELAADACCKKGFACSMLQRQYQSTGIVAPVISRASALG